ncbi:MAG: UvrB/UvrC motif-containing protein [Patescibacteria group bacterium]|nr:UvrB/UvrC motif-containing protein [Patescibacteria group bacterium]
MPHHYDIDHIFEDWPYQPGVVSARLLRAHDGRDIVQMRTELGLLQMEIEGRPDGERPNGSGTLLDALMADAAAAGKQFMLDEDQCFELDREFLQFYHRRICWLALREFARAIADADHTLAMMDFGATHATDPQWMLLHEQYRPFVLFHRTQAAALLQLQTATPEEAIDEIDAGLARIRSLYEQLEAAGHYEEDELVEQLVHLRESLREEYHVGRTLGEQLTDAIAAEQYERAALLRDQIRHRPRL